MLRQISLATLLVAVTAGAASAQTNWTWHKALAAGKTLDIRNISGTITATPASGNEVEVVAHRTRANDVEIRVEEYDGGVTICTIYEDGDDCRHDRGCNHGYRRHDCSDEVDFEVRVPRGVLLEAHSVTGDVTVTGMTADVGAGSVSGDVRVETAGIAEASSVSGSVHVHIGRNDWTRLSFSSVSGNVILEMPADLNADVRFNTLSGDVDSDWPINMTSERHSRYGPRGGIRGTIGKGGAQLSVSTVSGNLELRKNR